MELLRSLARSLARFFSCNRISPVPDGPPLISPPSPPPPATTASDLSDVVNPPRRSNAMLVGTLFGRRRGHVSFCLQAARASSRPYLLVNLPFSPQFLAQEMNGGVLRLALECDGTREGTSSCPLRRIPSWTAYCNGRFVGAACRREPSHRDRLFLKAMQSTSAGAGVFRPPAALEGGDEEEEILYMRSTYERVMGSPDSESFHLINPQGSPDQELSLFLLRSR